MLRSNINFSMRFKPLKQPSWNVIIPLLLKMNEFKMHGSMQTIVSIIFQSLIFKANILNVQSFVCVYVEKILENKKNRNIFYGWLLLLF